MAKEKKAKTTWRIVGTNITASAYTKSEARALFKAAAIDLKPGTKIERTR